ncbi:ATP-binding protein [Aerosakkonemataceae cyanobacterium BLCC-F154]|uniref:histidine kinase n=1 Tax=Floridaenema fluviatile BLCC-F154 TaxID=3153640 RepID=A0ABV4YI55_9CYAN
MQSEPKANVLLVDDHPENLIALEAVLDGLGQNLVKANSGEEALRCLLNQDFAVILLDVQMPGMDGFETATLIRQREKSRNTPIIFLTAFSTSDKLMFKGYSLGAVDYLLKPIDPVILNSKVSVFVDLFKKNLEVQQQAAQLAAMNAEIKQSEERFRTLSSCSPVGIFLTDTEGKCTYSNPRFQAICGFTTAESWQTECAKVAYAEDRDILLLEWPNFTRQGQAYSGEFRIYQPDESLRWVHIRTAPMLSDEGKLLGHVGTIEDITERKQAEAVREQFIREHAARQQAEDANRMKDEFLAILSHELRTPLNSILGWSRLLVTKKFDETTRIKALETIERNARSQARLVNDILDVSQIIQGNLRLSMQPVNLQNLVEVTVETARLQAEEKSIDIQTDLHSNALRVCGDPERLRQVLANLLSNAIKFTPESGVIEVRLKLLETSVSDRYAQLQVIDQGIGINPEFLPHVFDSFRQGNSSISRPYGGLGLGLAIARHLVELHDGTIKAESEGEGKGATFTIVLPLSNWTPETESDQKKPMISSGNDYEKEELNSQLKRDRPQLLLVEERPDTCAAQQCNIENLV